MGGTVFVAGYKRAYYYAGIYIRPVWFGCVPQQPAADNIAGVVYVDGEYCHYLLYR